MNEKELAAVLFEKYGANLTRHELAEVVRRSVASVDRDREAGLGPSFIKGRGLRARVLYPAHEVARWIVQSTVRTA